MEKNYIKNLGLAKYNDLFNIDPSDSLINVGDVFFISINSIQKWGFMSGPTPEYINLDAPGLVAVKYLGNGVLQEMLTGSKIVLEDVRKLDNDAICGYGSDYAAGFNFVVTDKQYANHDNSLISRSCSIISEYPLVHTMNENYFEDSDFVESYTYYADYLPITDESMRLYLSTSDEEKVELLKSFYEEAKKSSENVLYYIKKKYPEAFDISDEMISMANLENQLYDFKNSKSK